jgi:RNA polymerase sigma-70 factor (ECF subfamily)
MMAGMALVCAIPPTEGRRLHLKESAWKACPHSASNHTAAQENHSIGWGISGLRAGRKALPAMTGRQDEPAIGGSGPRRRGWKFFAFLLPSGIFCTAAVIYRLVGMPDCAERGVAVMFGRSAKSEEFEGAALPHLNDLFRTAVRLTRDRSEAEDLVQEAYLQAWKSFHRFEPGTNCRAWLFKILFHVIQHHRRKWFRMRLVSDETERIEETISYEPPVSPHLSDEDVLAAFDKIPPHYREVVLLTDVEELSYKEVAAALDIPLGTVMSRLNRGRRLLRQELAEFAEGYGIQQKGEGKGA